MEEERQRGKFLSVIFGGRSVPFEVDTRERNFELADNIKRSVQSGAITAEKGAALLSNLPNIEDQQKTSWISELKSLVSPEMPKTVGSALAKTVQEEAPPLAEKVASGVSELKKVPPVTEGTGEILKDVQSKADILYRGIEQSLRFVGQWGKDVIRAIGSIGLEGQERLLGGDRIEIPVPEWLGPEPIKSISQRAEESAPLLRVLGSPEIQASHLAYPLLAIWTGLEAMDVSALSPKHAVKEAFKEAYEEALEKAAKELGLESVDKLSKVEKRNIRKRVNIELRERGVLGEMTGVPDQTKPLFDPNLPKTNNFAIYKKDQVRLKAYPDRASAVEADEGVSSVVDMTEAPPVFGAAAPSIRRPKAAGEGYVILEIEKPTPTGLPGRFANLPPEQATFVTYYWNHVGDLLKVLDELPPANELQEEILESLDVGALTDFKTVSLRHGFIPELSNLRSIDMTGGTRFDKLYRLLEEREALRAWYNNPTFDFEKTSDVTDATFDEWLSRNQSVFDRMKEGVGFSPEVAGIDRLNWTSIYNIEEYDKDGRAIRTIKGGVKRKTTPEDVVYVKIPKTKMDSLVDLDSLERANPGVRLAPGQEDMTISYLQNMEKQGVKTVTLRMLKNGLNNLNHKERIMVQNVIDMMERAQLNEMPYDSFKTRIQVQTIPLEVLGVYGSHMTKRGTKITTHKSTDSPRWGGTLGIQEKGRSAYPSEIYTEMVFGSPLIRGETVGLEHRISGHYPQEQYFSHVRGHSFASGGESSPDFIGTNFAEKDGDLVFKASEIQFDLGEHHVVRESLNAAQENVFGSQVNLRSLELLGEDAQKAFQDITELVIPTGKNLSEARINGMTLEEYVDELIDPSTDPFSLDFFKSRTADPYDVYVRKAEAEFRKENIGNIRLADLDNAMVTAREAAKEQRRKAILNIIRDSIESTTFFEGMTEEQLQHQFKLALGANVKSATDNLVQRGNRYKNDIDEYLKKAAVLQNQFTDVLEPFTTHFRETGFHAFIRENLRRGVDVIDVPRGLEAQAVQNTKYGLPSRFKDLTMESADVGKTIESYGGEKFINVKTDSRGVSVVPEDKAQKIPEDILRAIDEPALKIEDIENQLMETYKKLFTDEEKIRTYAKDSFNWEDDRIDAMIASGQRGEISGQAMGAANDASRVLYHYVDDVSPSSIDLPDGVNFNEWRRHGERLYRSQTPTEHLAADLDLDSVEKRIETVLESKVESGEYPSGTSVIYDEKSQSGWLVDPSASSPTVEPYLSRDEILSGKDVSDYEGHPIYESYETEYPKFLKKMDLKEGEDWVEYVDTQGLHWWRLMATPKVRELFLEGERLARNERRDTQSNRPSGPTLSRA